MDIFLSVVGLLVLLVCFWLWMASFSVCSLFGLPFVLLCFLSVYPFLSLSRYVPYPFRSMACKKRRGTQVQIVSRIDSPPPARPARYRSDGRPRIISDIGRSRGRPSIPPEDRFGPLGSEPAWPSAAAFLLLDRYRVQIIRNGWKFPISKPQGTCHTDGSSDPVLGL